MKFFALLLLTAMAGPAQGQSPFRGRWDLTITAAGQTYPSWMEVSDSGEVRVVGRVATVHPVQDTKIEAGHLRFTSMEYFGKQIKMTWDLAQAGGKLTGTQKRDTGITGTISGQRAPKLDRKPPAAWSKPEPLFNGRDLTGWEPLVTEQGKPPENHYKAIGGELVNEAPGANLRTTRKFQDFKLHLEYNCPKDGNSGVYLRGRYEFQVEYEPAGHNGPANGMGSIYGFLAPQKVVPPRPGEWETLDVTLVGRYVTVVRNGVTTMDHLEIPGITGGALDSQEGEPQSLYIQGDHTGGMKYRNITISVPR